jgi:hypothetical protein
MPEAVDCGGLMTRKNIFVGSLISRNRKIPGQKRGRIMTRALIDRRFLFVILIILVWGLMGNAGEAAESTYVSILCNNKVVSVGDTKQEVLIKCGEPLSKSVDEVVDTKLVERWTYKIGGFYRPFVFEGGELKYIEAGRLAD